MLGRHHTVSARSKIDGRKLKSVMARKADSELGPERDFNLEHELQVARYLSVSGWITLARSMPICRSEPFGSTSPVK
jgi:hypothetical protein